MHASAEETMNIENEHCQKHDSIICGCTGEKREAAKGVEFHKKCNDCGRFLKKELWVRKDHPRKAHGLCHGCFSNYDC